MPIRNTPILEIVIGQLRDNGFKDIVLSVGYLHHLIRSYFGDGNRLGVNITYSKEEEPLGTAGPLSLLAQIDEPVLVMNADLLCNLDYGDLFRHHARRRASMTLGLFRKEVKIDLGVLTTDNTGHVRTYTEKPTLNYDVSMGIYVIDPSIHALVRKRPGERLDFPDLVNQMLLMGKRVSAYHFDGFWLDIGRPADYEKACAEFEYLIRRPADEEEAVEHSLVVVGENGETAVGGR
jgi:NDP-sugar pyrophosphorylase family protein